MTSTSLQPALFAENVREDIAYGSDTEDAERLSPIFTDSAESNASSTSSSLSPGLETELSIQKSGSSLPKMHAELAELFSENVVAKLWKVAVREIEKENPPTTYPERILCSGLNANKYDMRPADFWTCGFFPGSLYTLLERSIKYPKYFPIPTAHRSKFHERLLSLCRAWTVPIRAMETRTDTHDLGFIIQPALRLDWELTGNLESLNNIVKAAHSLASRYSSTVAAIRSWDALIHDRYNFNDMKSNFIIIIDSMCNIDLLYFAGYQTGNQELIDIATTHARTVLRTIVRENWSTYHVLNFSPLTGSVQNRITGQGYADESTWSRGQSWAILGFTQTYTWTQDPIFLDAAINLADYFLARLDDADSAGTHSYPYVPLWDFDAPLTPTTDSVVLRDTSAGMVAANGMLLLHQILVSQGRVEEGKRFLEAVLRITTETIALSLAEKAEFERVEVRDGDEAPYPSVNDDEAVHRFDGILKHATANNSPTARMPYSDHGLVYADYYFLELGNKLLRMGLI